VGLQGREGNTLLGCQVPFSQSDLAIEAPAGLSDLLSPGADLADPGDGIQNPADRRGQRSDGPGGEGQVVNGRGCRQ